MEIGPGDWCYSLDHDEPGRVIAVDVVWGEETAQVWLARRDAVVRLHRSRLQPLDGAVAPSLDQLCYVASAARILDAMERDALIAPLEGSVIPLPHQLYALQRAMSADRVRYLLADEVGLGKTIEAGLILRELKVRGLAKRILVVAPAGLTSQWVSEMKTHFSEDFRLVQPGNFPAWRQLAGIDEKENLWRLHDQVVCPLDSIKPMDTRRGWSREQVARYNRERFEDLVSAGWDLVIIDEAHRLGGSSEQVARYRLGEALAQASPYLLLLSATPHQGKTDAFRRLVAFVDPDALPDDESVTRDNVAPYVIRTEKRRAIDADGKPLFLPRHTQEDTVELRVREVLEEKLQRILDEFGVDKLSDVLDSEEGGVDFEQLYVGAVLSPEEAEARAEALAESIRARARSAREGSPVLAATEALDPSAAKKVAGHQMPFWTERMTVAWLRTQAARGASVQSKAPGVYDLTWPSGGTTIAASFSRAAADDPGKTLLTIEDPRIRGLTTRIPPYAPGMQVAQVVIPGVSDKVGGFWSLWRVGLSTFDGREQRVLPIFVTPEGQTLGPTARVVWDRLVELTDGLVVLPVAATADGSTERAFEQSREAAEHQGKAAFHELRERHRERLSMESRKMNVAFAARRRAIEKLGLPQVRDFRLAQLAEEEAAWRRDVEAREHGLPELSPMLLVAVARTGGAP